MRIAPQPGKLNAPGTSHLESFRLIYPPPGTRQSFEIEVVFRSRKSSARATYRYAVGVEANALAIMRQMRLTKSPGVVVHAVLDGYPYRQIG